MLHVHVSVSFAKYGTLTALTIFGHKWRSQVSQVKFIIKSTKFYKNNANPQIAEANLGG